MPIADLAPCFFCLDVSPGSCNAHMKMSILGKQSGSLRGSSNTCNRGGISTAASIVVPISGFVALWRVHSATRFVYAFWSSVGANSSYVLLACQNRTTAQYTSYSISVESSFECFQPSSRISRKNDVRSVRLRVILRLKLQRLERA